MKRAISVPASQVGNKPPAADHSAPEQNGDHGCCSGRCRCWRRLIPAGDASKRIPVENPRICKCQQDQDEFKMEYGAHTKRFCLHNEQKQACGDHQKQAASCPRKQMAGEGCYGYMRGYSQQPQVEQQCTAHQESKPQDVENFDNRKQQRRLPDVNSKAGCLQPFK